MAEPTINPEDKMFALYLRDVMRELANRFPDTDSDIPLLGTELREQLSERKLHDDAIALGAMTDHIIRQRVVNLTPMLDVVQENFINPDKEPVPIPAIDRKSDHSVSKAARACQHLAPKGWGPSPERRLRKKYKELTDEQARACDLAYACFSQSRNANRQERISTIADQIEVLIRRSLAS